MSDSQPTPQPVREPVRVKPLYLVLGGFGVVAAIVVAVLLFTGKGDDNGGAPGGDGEPSATTTGGFAFKLEPAQALMTSPDTNPDRAAKAAKPAAAQTEKLMHELFVNAYLNPGAWVGGAYDGVFDGFSDGAKAEALAQLDVMTAGTTAADTIDSIKAKDASLKQKVLIDPNGQPYSVVAVVTFTATAELKDGTTATLVSQGQYILEKAGSAWQVTSFSVTRSDESSSAGSGTGSVTSSPTAVAS